MMKARLQDAWNAFIGAFQQVEDESAASQEAHRGKISFHIIAVLCIGCVVLSFLEYHGSSSDYAWFEVPLGWFVDDPSALLDDMFQKGERAELFRLSYWAGACFVGYFLIPALYIKVVRREKLRDYGLRVKGIFEHAWIYVAMYLLVMPFVVVVAFSESFRKTYPFYDNAGASLLDFFGWEIIYAVQFFSLEFFFRGFLIHGTRMRFGFYAIVFSAVPYCMIHFGKPLPETLGAVIAGLALGILALFTRSVWLGFAIHVSVAISMDAISVALKWIDQFALAIR